MKKSYSLLLPLLGLIVTACATNPTVTARAPAATNSGPCPVRDDKDWEKKLIIHHIYVGQGDSTFVRTPSGMTVLIDGGLEGQGNAAVLPVLKNCYQMDKPAVDYVVLTHPHNDHYGGLIDLFLDPNFVQKGLFHTGEKVKADNGPLKFAKYLNRAKQFKPQIPKPGEMLFHDGDVKFEVMAVNGVALGQSKPADNVIDPKDGLPKDPNAVSIALKITYGKFKYFIGGDLSGGGPKGGTAGGVKVSDVESLVASKVGSVDVYHADHHGSGTSSNATLLAALSPEQVIISLGSAGSNMVSYHFPHKLAIDQMVQAHVKNIFMTSKGVSKPSFSNSLMHNLNGDIVLTTDGDNYAISGKSETHSFTAGAK